METPKINTEFATIINLMQTIPCFYENFFNLASKHAGIVWFTKLSTSVCVPMQTFY